MGKHSLVIWSMFRLCLMWSIWRECNQHTFEDVECMGIQFLATFSSSLIDWS